MRFVGIAMLLMVVAAVATHLGLSQAIGSVVTKVCRCHKCLSFWLSLFGLAVAGCPAAVAVLLSILAAYASGWFALLLILMNNLFERLWQRLNK